MSEKINLMIATPAYGGLVTVNYMNSLLATMTNPNIKNKINIILSNISNDALVQRARQELIKNAMDAKVDKILFIDADISFTPQNVMDVVLTDKMVVAGTYRKKSADPILNFNLIDSITKNVHEKIGKTTNSVEGFKMIKNIADPQGLVPAKHLATGFMCIDMRVVGILKSKVDNYVTDNRPNDILKLSPEQYAQMTVPEIFPVRVHNNILESEDWGFCRLCEESDIAIFLQTKVVCPHIGNLPLVFPN